MLSLLQSPVIRHGKVLQPTELGAIVVLDEVESGLIRRCTIRWLMYPHQCKFNYQVGLASAMFNQLP